MFASETELSMFYLDKLGNKMTATLSKQKRGINFFYVQKINNIKLQMQKYSESNMFVIASFLEWHLESIPKNLMYL